MAKVVISFSDLVISLQHVSDQISHRVSILEFSSQTDAMGKLGEQLLLHVLY